MESQYTDTWREVTAIRENGYTIGTVRFDYIFRAFDQGWLVTPVAAPVIDSTLSDHRAVMADFEVQ